MPNVRHAVPSPRGQHQPKPRRTTVVLVARCFARASARQTCALTHGRRCKPVRGRFEGPPSCYCLRFECVVGRGGRVLRTHSPRGQTLPKITDGPARGGRCAPSPVGPRAGGGGGEVGLHVHAELRWGWGVAWRRPRAPARAPTSLAKSPSVRAGRAWVKKNNCFCFVIKSKILI